MVEATELPENPMPERGVLKPLDLMSIEAQEKTEGDGRKYYAFLAVLSDGKKSYFVNLYSYALLDYGNFQDDVVNYTGLLFWDDEIEKERMTSARQTVIDAMWLKRVRAALASAFDIPFDDPNK